MSLTKILTILLLLNEWFDINHGFTFNQNHRTSFSLSSSSEDQHEKVSAMLWKMTEYFSSMVDKESKTFYTYSYPPTGERAHEHCPVRELGVVFDALVLMDYNHHMSENKDKFMQQYDTTLSSAICQTIKKYQGYVVTNDEGITLLDSQKLKEQTNIAHSGFLVLVSTLAIQQNLMSINTSSIDFEKLLKSILSVQRHDGAFFTEYGNNDVDKMKEFYPGECMVSLLEAYEHANVTEEEYISSDTKCSIIPAMKLAFQYYSSLYFNEEVDRNYPIWQIQAFARFYHILKKEKDNDSNAVATYVISLCDDINSSVSWKMLNRGPSFYPNLQTIEIACGLDCLTEGLRIVKHEDEDKVRYYQRSIQNAIEYLHHMQNQIPESATIGKGGLGDSGTYIQSQRIDVTGHSIHGLVKLLSLYL